MYNIQNIQNLKIIIFRIHLFANAICKKGNLFPFIRAGIRTMGAEDSHCDGTPTPRLVMMAMMMTRRRTTMTMTRRRMTMIMTRRGRRRMVVTTTRRMRMMTTLVHLWPHFFEITITAFQNLTSIEVLWRLQLISPDDFTMDKILRDHRRSISLISIQMGGRTYLKALLQMPFWWEDHMHACLKVYKQLLI